MFPCSSIKSLLSISTQVLLFLGGIRCSHASEEVDVAALYELFVHDSTELHSPENTTLINHQIPSWLNGTLINNGSGGFQIRPNGRVFQGFIDGFAKLERWRINDGQAQFSLRYIRSKLYNHSLDKNDLIYAFLYVDPVEPPFEDDVLSKIPPAINDNKNVNLWQYDDDVILAETELGLGLLGKEQRIDPEHLTTHPFEFGDHLRLLNLRSPHPHNPVGSTDWTFGVHLDIFSGVPPLVGEYYTCLHKVKRGGKLNRQNVACTLLRGAATFHSFATSERFAILMEYPFYLDTRISVLLKDGIVYEWLPKFPTRVLIAPLDLDEPDDLSKKKEHQKFATFEMPTTHWGGHALNAYEVETGDPSQVEVVVDWGDVHRSGDDYLAFIRNEDQPHTIAQSFPNVPENGRTKRFRFQLRRSNRGGNYDIVSGGEEFTFSKRLRSGSEEYQATLPRINYDFRGKPYCYVYSLGIQVERKEYTILKHDLCRLSDLDENGDPLVISHVHYEEGHIPTEPVFVPNPSADDEDDGVVLSTVYDGALKLSYLLILNATDFTVVDKAYTPIRSFWSTHGRFFQADSQKSY